MARRISIRGSSFNMLNSSKDELANCFYHKDSHPQQINSDIIGPADPVSNLRPVVFKVTENESKLEKKLRLQREDVQRWNQHFWTQHNSNFFKKKEDFINNLHSEGEINLTEKRALTAEEMSTFYKTFLDENWEVHVNYNKEWYRRNFSLLFLSYRVKCEKIKRKIFSY